MNFVSRREFIVGAILLLLISDIKGADESRRKRQINKGVKNDLDWQVILNDIRKIPLFGRGLSKGFEDLGRTVNKVDELTNGALSRIAGGYPPCIIDLDGVHCNGKAENGGIVGIAEDLIKSTPLPGIAKKMIVDLFDSIVFPFFDVIVGVPVPSSKNT